MRRLHTGVQSVEGVRLTKPLAMMLSLSSADYVKNIRSHSYLGEQTSRGISRWHGRSLKRTELHRSGVAWHTGQGKHKWYRRKICYFPNKVQHSFFLPFILRTSLQHVGRLQRSQLNNINADGLLLPNSFIDFAFRHWFGCCATEPGYPGDIGAVEIWLIDWLFHRKQAWVGIFWRFTTTKHIQKP